MSPGAAGDRQLADQEATERKKNSERILIKDNFGGGQKEALNDEAKFEKEMLVVDPDRKKKRFVKGLNLTQKDICTLSKQTNLKNQLRMQLRNLDRELTRKCSMMKFKEEANSLGLQISESDYTVILIAFCIDKIYSQEFEDIIRIMSKIDAQNQP